MEPSIEGREWIARARAGLPSQPEEEPLLTNPGARSFWALFGEVLLVGVLVALTGLLVLTLPAAMAAGVRHLRRFAAAHDTRPGLFWADFRDALPGGVVLGAGLVVLTGLLLLDIDLARSGFLPGGPVVEMVGWLGLGVVALTLLAAAGQWSRARGWRGALRRVQASVRRDIPGALYLVATAVFVVIVTWALLPLLVPALGCAALAVAAIPGRPRRTA